MVSKDKIHGGLGDNQPDERFDPEQLEKGLKIEFEHSNDPEIAKEIVRDHLQESKDFKGEKGGKYYDKLEKMEDDIKDDLMNKKEYSQIHTLVVLAQALEALDETNGSQIVYTLAALEKQAQELVWPFPAPETLQNLAPFIASALAWAAGEGSGLYQQAYGSSENLRNEGKIGEIKAARVYMRYLMKDVAPKLATQLQEQWQTAIKEGNTEKQKTLRKWWSSLADVWTLLQRLIKLVNSYEK